MTLMYTINFSDGVRSLTIQDGEVVSPSSWPVAGVKFSTPLRIRSVQGGTISVYGDHAARFEAGFAFDIIGTSNDGSYTVDTNASFDGTFTSIETVEALNDEIGGTILYSVPSSEVETTLTLFGRGATNIGEFIAENFLHLIENFASNTAPPNPTVGQIWYNTNSSTLQVYNGTSFGGIDAATVAGYDPDTGTTAGTIPVRNVSGELPGNITGSAADSALLNGRASNTGTGANTVPVRNGSGELPGNITGNAATATTAVTATTANDSNLLDGYDTSTGTTATTIPVRNGSGDLPGNITGTAASAAQWTTARTLTLDGDVSGAQSINGSSDVTLTVSVIDDSHTHDTRYYTETESDALFVTQASTQTITGLKTFNTAINFAVRTIVADRILDDTDYTIFADATAGIVTVTLPPATAGRLYNIKKIDSVNDVLVAPEGAETIDGSNTPQALNTQYDSITVQSDGTQWFIL